MHINLATLQITQHGLRNTNQLKNMVEFVKRHGYFDQNAMSAFHVCDGRPDVPSLIHIADIKGQLFIHDGHHRAMAAYLGGRHHIFDKEFCIFEYSWEDYLKPNLDKQWHTPFDPRTEVRLTDMSRYRRMMSYCKDDEELRSFAIKNFSYYYKTERKLTWLHEMANSDPAISQYHRR
jgi:hypothetical protein